MEHFTLNTIYEVLGDLQKSFENMELTQEEVGLEHLFGRYASEDVIVKEDIPGFDRALIDGYAVISGDTYGIDDSLGKAFTQIGQSEIGEECTVNLGPNECVYISSGAMMPPNADSVVSPDDIEITGPGEIVINRLVDRWENVTRKGDDLKKGNVLIREGSRIGAREIGALAGSGSSHIKVGKKLKVSVISSGAEIVEAFSSSVGPGKVRDINSHMICDAIKSFGAIPVNMGIAKDDSKQIESMIADSLDVSDIIIISGGSSQGTMDKTLNTIKRIDGVEILTDKIAIEPGHDTVIARVGNKAVFGLPGNPIAVLITLHILVRPLILWLNKSQPRNFIVKARCTEDYKSAAGREEYVLVSLELGENDYTAVPIINKKSFITSMNKGNGYVKIRASDEGLKRGQEVEVIVLQNHIQF